MLRLHLEHTNHIIREYIKDSTMGGFIKKTVDIEMEAINRSLSPKIKLEPPTWKGCEEMALIKLFSGMDFSGKSTTVQNLSIEMPGKFKCQQKFITPIQTLQEMIDNNIWIPRKDFIPLLQEMVLTDVQDYCQKDLILQDTLWVIKFTTKLLTDGKNIYETE